MRRAFENLIFQLLARSFEHFPEDFSAWLFSKLGARRLPRTFHLLIDGQKLHVDLEPVLNGELLDHEVVEELVVHGDQRSLSIAAASILAKVVRDRIMKGYAEVFEGYGFEKNKGYASAAHLQILKERGACPIHRKNFGKVARMV